ncbi:CaiB/BaiF CoA transferase family protein [Streptomyces canus]|uniref:Crotonobetainyl-CoA:carnitine CoA-transferase CaiB-like acyl-CoA transferase n=1 Tax=Streptomyces canus TaxID=58343 RepID=A0AAW8FNA0_9ACTN|nr:CoA transferase [Streptomyces canus]MDQ0760584.1 crotonobetainyl-CoA:carnitine CoA-transferase CaiB-like acyl-CoA transferase [Streptomyces canus]MDQ0910770.1 crotonobetainyl-CoA:carnitine CoA-transferase CaiB-like acyl-CoA transferase [Streptomyces canus]
MSEDERNTAGRGQLRGLKVVEFAHVVAGPLAGSMLADQGADVVHVEPPGAGDAARAMGPQRDGVPLWFKVAGRNKRSVTLDLHQEAGRAVARRLVAWADVVIVTLRAGRLRSWGLDWDSVHRINPRAVLLQISGFGATSSQADAPGFGKMGEARSGVVHLTGFPDGPPVHTGFSHGDAVTGLMGAYAVLAALHRRDHDPGFDGEWIDLALFESLFRLVEWQVIVHDQLGQVPDRSGNQLAVAPAAVINTYRSRDGEWITVTSATLRSVRNIVRLLGLPEKEFAAARQQHDRRGELDEGLRNWVAERGTGECLEEFARAEVVASRVFDAADIAADPVYAEREDIVTVDDPDLGAVRMQAVIPHFRQRPGRVWRTGPALGQDNHLVYGQWLGLSAEELAHLEKSDVI